MSKNYKFNSKYIITDESEEENINVDWSINSEEETKKDNIELDDLDELEELDDINETNTGDFKNELNIELINNPEINIEIVNHNNEKGVKININIGIEKNKENKSINIDFIISKDIFLKIAKELKK